MGPCFQLVARAPSAAPACRQMQQSSAVLRPQELARHPSLCREDTCIEDHASISRVKELHTSVPQHPTAHPLHPLLQPAQALEDQAGVQGPAAACFATAAAAAVAAGTAAAQHRGSIPQEALKNQAEAICWCASAQNTWAQSCASKRPACCLLEPSMDMRSLTSRPTCMTLEESAYILIQTAS